MEQKYQSQDDFGTFLSSMNSAIHEHKEQKSGQKASIRIVRYLARNKDTRVESIMIHVKTPWAEFNDGLKNLTDAGLIKVDDEEDGSIIELTEDGLHWAQTMLDWDDNEEEM